VSGRPTRLWGAHARSRGPQDARTAGLWAAVLCKAESAPSSSAPKWPTTAPGTRAFGQCPPGFVYPSGEPLTRECHAGGSWGPPPQGQCVGTRDSSAPPGSGSAWAQHLRDGGPWRPTSRTHAALVATNCTDPIKVTLPSGASLETTAGRALAVTAIVSLAPGCSLAAPTLRFTWQLAGPGSPMENANVTQALRRNSTTVTIPANMCGYARARAPGRAARCI